MRLHSVIMDGQDYVMVPRARWNAIAGRVGDHGKALVEPPPAADGTYGVAHIRISLANKVATQRKAAGLTQAELARRAKVRPETICRLEAGKHMPSARTFDRIDRVLQGGAARAAATATGRKVSGAAAWRKSQKTGQSG